MALAVMEDNRVTVLRRGIGGRWCAEPGHSHGPPLVRRDHRDAVQVNACWRGGSCHVNRSTPVSPGSRQEARKPKDHDRDQNHGERGGKGRYASEEVALSTWRLGELSLWQ